MTTFRVRLPERQARLVTLAVVYHLARPGSEIDRETMRDYRHGLREVLPILEAQHDQEHVIFDLNPLQGTLLSTAFSSTLSELKMYSLVDTMAGKSSRPRSTAAGFDDRLRDLFPEVTGDPSYASTLAEEMAMLRREMPFAQAREKLEEERLAEAAERQGRKKVWQFWKRS
jgi:hypothetical protein